MGLFEVSKPSHFPATLLKSLTAAGCHWRVSQGAMELQATMRCKKAKPINPTIFFIYILLWQSNGRWAQGDGDCPRSESADGDDLSGNVKLKVEPLPTSLSTQIFPPCSSTNFLAKVNPSPVPSVLCA